VTDQTRAAVPSPRSRLRDAAVDRRPGQAQTVLGLMVGVAVLDQTTKWWGWRHAARAIVNTGSTWFIGQPVSGWYSGPLTGQLMDGLSCGLLSLAVLVLLRRRRSPVVLVSGALAIGGWSSNLLDRLGMHLVNAPDSARGVVDFIRVGPPFYNVADVIIAGSTVVFLAATCARGLRVLRPVPRAGLPPAPLASVLAVGGGR
jgi:lipoprotein signal peptidase